MMKSFRSLVNKLSLCLLSLGLAVTGGCVSTAASDDAELRLTLTSGGQVLLNGSAVQPGALPGALKAQGIALDTAIRVAIPASAPMDRVKDLSRRLASAGYRRVVFARPQHADVVADPPGVPR